MYEYNEYLNPNFVYISFDNRSLLKTKLNQVIHNFSNIGKYNNGNYVFSTCSGKIIDMLEIETSMGKTNSLVIENDFKDKPKKLIPTTQNIFRYDYDKIREVLEYFGFSYLFKNDIKKLVISIDYNIGNYRDSVLFKNYSSEFLEILDCMENIFGFEVYIQINKKDKILYSEILNYMGTYPNINLIVKDVNEAYKISVIDLFKIYSAVKRNKNINDTFFTIVDNKKNYVISSKIGTNLAEILKFLKLNVVNVEVDGKKYNLNDINYIISEYTKVIKV